MNFNKHFSNTENYLAEIKSLLGGTESPAEAALRSKDYTFKMAHGEGNTAYISIAAHRGEEFSSIKVVNYSDTFSSTAIRPYKVRVAVIRGGLVNEYWYLVFHDVPLQVRFPGRFITQVRIYLAQDNPFAVAKDGVLSVESTGNASMQKGDQYFGHIRLSAGF